MRSPTPLALALLTAAAACTGSAVTPPRDAGGGAVGGTAGGGASGSAGRGAAGAAGTGASGAGGVAGGSGGATTVDAGTPVPGDGGAPPGFWDASNIPPAQNALMFKFLNRTNGQYPDSQVFWKFNNQTHSIADAPLFDMPANSSGRMYFYLGDPASKYFDFIEFTIGTAFNGNTTRVDAFGIKIAMRLHAADGYDVAVGEDYATFAEDRAVTFQKFMDETPPEFAGCLAQAPYRIIEPGAGGFNAGGAQQHYYDSIIDQIWTANGLTVARPGPNGSGLGSFPDLSAAIYRHVGNVAGSFGADGKLANKSLWSNAATFYTAAPADYYARFWHAHALNGKAYGFPYDDVGGYSSFISHGSPQYLLIAIGW